MLHLRHAWDVPRKDTDAMLWGRAVHCLLFEPREFEARYTCWEGRRAGGAYQDFVEDHCGMEVLTAAQYEGAMAAGRRFTDESLVLPLIESGQSEVSVFCPEAGLQCRGRMDRVSTDGVIVDLKTTKDLEARAFGRDFYRFHYDIKLGLYRRWLSKVLGYQFRVVVVCLENCGTPSKPEGPYDIAVVPIADAVLDRGAERGVSILRRVAACIESEYWPGVAEGEEYWLDVPTWEMDDLEGAEVVNAD